MDRGYAVGPTAPPCEAGTMDDAPTSPDPTSPAATGPFAGGPRVEITYCTQCRWLLRATWLGSELLTSFGTEIGELALRPGTRGGVPRPGAHAGRSARA